MIHKRICSFTAVLVLLAVGMGITPGLRADTPQELPPWTLRDKYSFGTETLILEYAQINAEWRVKIMEEDSEQSRMHPDVILRDVGFSIALGDGRIITNDMLRATGETIFGRESYTCDFFGPATKFSVKFVPYESLYVEHQIVRFRNWNFLLISVEVHNQGDAPVEVTRIQSAILEPGALSGLSDTAQVHSRNFVFRGGHPVFTNEGVASTMRIDDPQRAISMALGILPSDKAESGIDIVHSGGTWQGRIESSFAPGISVAPGASVSSDPIWFCMDIPQVVADAQYAWLLRSYCRNESLKQAPRAWVTIPETVGLSVLRGEAEKARGLGITHALIPGNWEERPGSMEGGPPQYPRNIASAARTLRETGMTPGITIDPLLADSSSGGWRAQSEDGRNWVNLRVEEGRTYATDRIRDLIRAGFAFVVVEKSLVPDEILRGFGMTRAQADTLALDVANAATDGAPIAVLPASTTRLALARDDWLEAAAAVSRMAEYDIAPAAIQVRAGGDTPMDEETMVALRFWHGPIEFIGAPSRALQSQFAMVLQAPPLVVRPQDAARRSPRTWLLRRSSAALGHVGTALLTFPGAMPWDITAIEMFGNEDAPTVLWRPNGDTPIHVADGIIPAPTALSTHGVLLNAPHPVFAGTTENITLGHDRLRHLEWDGASGRLTGQIEPAPGVTHAFFFMPANFTLNDARVGSRRVRAEVTRQWISLPLEASGGAFELEFAPR